MHKQKIIFLILCVLALSIIPSYSFEDQTIKDFNSIVQNKGQKIKKNIQKHPIKIAFATPLKVYQTIGEEALILLKAEWMK